MSVGKMQSELEARLLRIAAVDEQNFNLTGTQTLAWTFVAHQIYLKNIGVNKLAMQLYDMYLWYEIKRKLKQWVFKKTWRLPLRKLYRLSILKTWDTLVFANRKETEKLIYLAENRIKSSTKLRYYVTLIAPKTVFTDVLMSKLRAYNFKCWRV